MRSRSLRFLSAVMWNVGLIFCLKGESFFVQRWNIVQINEESEKHVVNKRKRLCFSLRVGVLTIGSKVRRLLRSSVIPLHANTYRVHSWTKYTIRNVRGVELQQFQLMYFLRSWRKKTRNDPTWSMYRQRRICIGEGGGRCPPPPLGSWRKVFFNNFCVNRRKFSESSLESAKRFSRAGQMRKQISCHQNGERIREWMTTQLTGTISSVNWHFSSFQDSF